MEKSQSTNSINRPPKIVRIAKATRSPAENRIAFHFTFGELAKSSVLNFLVLFNQKKKEKKYERKAAMTQGNKIKEVFPPNCAEHNFVQLANKRRGAKNNASFITGGCTPSYQDGAPTGLKIQ